MKLAQLFTDAAGKPSWGRTGSFMALVSVLMWDTVYVLQHWSVVTWPHQLPSGGDLSGQALFVGTLFGLSKGIDAIKAATSKPDTPGETTKQTTETVQTTVKPQ